ncbi:hypothetical protein JCM6882_009111 [Rhodosporidiobolus microsporus]
MAAVRHYGVRNEPLQPIKQARGYDSVPPKSRKQQEFEGDSDGLAITYNMHDDQPVYRADVHPDSMGWNTNHVPITRNKQNGNFLSAYDAENDKSNRADSVFDAYVDMYADYSDGGEDDGEDTQENLSITVPQTAPLRMSNSRPKQDDLEPYDAQPQAREPWDERGKTGLYGGGGRGADDQETGWVRDYAFSPPQQAPGFEEDLQFDGDEEVGPKDRKGSRGSRGSRATQGRRADDGRRRSSSDTAPSSYGPITPVSANFNSQSTAPKHAYADSGYRSAGSPPQSAPSMRHAHSHSNDSSFAASQHRSSTPPPPVPTPVRPSRVSPPPQPVHTIDPSLVKKKANTASFPVPSAPMPVGAPGAMPTLEGKPVPLSERPRRKSAFSKFGRGKKAPAISAPILPEGFVESLGMETFALYPGCKPPAHAILSPVMRDSSDRPQSAGRTITPPPARTVSPPSARSATPPSARKAAPRPQQTGPRPLHLPSMKLGLAQPDRAPSPALATPVRLPLDALRDDTDAASEGYPEDAFRRLSKTSDGSYAPAAGEQSSKVQSRKYFDNIRQEHARHEEVQANRGVVPTNAPGVPPVRHHDSPSSASSQGPGASFSPQTSVRSGGSSTVNGFRDPWSGGAGPSSRNSVHSQRTAANRNSYYQGGGGDRASMASTAHEHDFRRDPAANYRKGSYVSTRSRLSHYDGGRGTSSPSPEVPVPSIVTSNGSSPFQPQLGDRNGSVSSAYSEVSEAPPTNDFHPRNNPGFEPRNAVGHLRKNSLAGISSLPLPPSISSGASSSSHASSQETYAPVAPLNLSRRPSHVYGQNKFGGDVVWGGVSSAGLGGPKDLASPIPEAMSPPLSIGEDKPTIGTTGFRNPFG